MEKLASKIVSPPPFSVLAIDHVVIRAKDSGALKAFYRDILGCGVVWDRPDLGLTHLRAGSAMIDIVAIEGPLGREGVSAYSAYGRNVDHLCLRIANFDFDVLRAHFARHQIHIDPPKERFGAAGHGLSIYLTDLEGNGIELKA